DAKLVPCQFNQDSSAAMDGSSSKSVSDAPGVGVECGARTGLLALIFGTEEAGRRFLSSNPVLQKTLVIRVQNCIAIWLKPENRLPPQATIDEAVVRTEGIVPVYATAESTIV